MNSIDEKTKQKAYSAYLGFMKSFMNKLRLKPEGLVAMANELAMEGMGCPEPPAIDKKTVGKMGLKGVAGFRYASGTPVLAGSGKKVQKRNPAPIPHAGNASKVRKRARSGSKTSKK